MDLVSRLRLAVVCLALGASAVPALAQTDPWQSHLDYLEGRAKINGILLRQDMERVKKGQPSTAAPRSLPTSSYPAAPQTPGAGAIVPLPNGDVEVVRGHRGTGPGSEVIDVQVREVFPKRKIVQRIVESLPVVGTAVSGALLIKELLDEARIMEGPGGTILMDPGKPEELLTLWRWRIPFTSTQTEYIFGSAEDACAAAFQHCDGQSPGAWCVPDSAYDGSTQCTFDTFRSNPDGSVSATGRATYSITQRTDLACPPGQVISFWADDWCTTPPEEWTPATVEEATDRAEPKLPATEAPQVLRELDEKGIGVGGDLPSVQGPASIHRGRETTVNPDGSTTVRDVSSDIRYGPQPASDGTVWPGWEWSDRETVRTYPPGATIPAPDDNTAPPPDQETITEGNPGTGLEDLITCGLPWTPPCKIDEGGTPPPPPPDSMGDADGPFDPIRGIIENPPVPDTSWTWSFELPVGCSPYPFEAFSPWIPAIDVCQFQPQIHDVMSMLWIGGTIWLLVGMFGRALSEGG